LKGAFSLESSKTAQAQTKNYSSCSASQNTKLGKQLPLKMEKCVTYYLDFFPIANLEIELEKSECRIGIMIIERKFRKIYKNTSVANGF
jgi:hypothetical protein